MTLPLSEFFDLLSVQSRMMHPDAPQSSDRTRGGKTIISRFGDVLWRGSIEIPRALHVDAAADLALVEYVYNSMSPFLIYDRVKPGPRMDPRGTLIAGASPLVRTVSADRTTITLKGLPAGYVLMRGDLIGIAYSGRRYLGRVVTASVVAADNGNTPDLLLSLAAPVGIGPDNPVTLFKPSIKARFIETSFPTATSAISSGLSFEFQQEMDPDA